MELPAFPFWRSFSPCWERVHFLQCGLAKVRTAGEQMGLTYQEWGCHLTSCFQHTHFHSHCLECPRWLVLSSMTRSTTFPSHFSSLLFGHRSSCHPLQSRDKGWCALPQLPKSLSLLIPWTKQCLVLHSWSGGRRLEGERRRSILFDMLRCYQSLSWRFSSCRNNLLFLQQMSYHSHD